MYKCTVTNLKNLNHENRFTIFFLLVTCFIGFLGNGSMCCFKCTNLQCSKVIMIMFYCRENMHYKSLKQYFY